MTMWGDEAGQKWNDGYVVDTPYTESIFADLNPAMFSMAAVLMGQPPINPSKPSTWIDLGCGNGLTACMVAARRPPSSKALIPAMVVPAGDATRSFNRPG